MRPGAGYLSIVIHCRSPLTVPDLVQYPELAIQVAALALSLFSGHVVATLLNLVGTGLLASRHWAGKQSLDSLELWKLLSQAKKWTYYKLAAFGSAFAFTMFRCELVSCSARAG
jgi:Cornichon protein